MLSDRNRQIVTHYLRHFDKKRACKENGLSVQTAKDIFARPDVKEEIERRLRLAEGKTERNKEWLCNLLEKMIESYYSHNPLLLTQDEFLSTEANPSEMPVEARSIIDKVKVKYKRKGQKYARKDVAVDIEGFGYKEIKAAQELLAKLRGWVEDNKITVNLEDDLINRINKGRERIASEQAPDSGSAD